jgi:hypothetical protein
MGRGHGRVRIGLSPKPFFSRPLSGLLKMVATRFLIAVEFRQRRIVARRAVALPTRGVKLTRISGAVQADSREQRTELRVRIALLSEFGNVNASGIGMARIDAILATRFPKGARFRAVVTSFFDLTSKRRGGGDNSICIGCIHTRWGLEYEGSASL